MAELKDFSLYDIDWNLTPEQAVTMYLEWGNNDWTSEYPPVRSKADVSTYFVVDSWQDPPVIRLVQRNSEQATDLFTMPMPQELLDDWHQENRGLKGISAPTRQIRQWLKKQLGQEDINS